MESVLFSPHRQPSTCPLTELAHLLKEDLEKVNSLILKELHSDVTLIPKLAGHLINGGGKRIRPLLLLASNSLCSYKGNQHIDLATSVEFIHTASLLHDDVVDASMVRRSRPSANALWGNQASVLVGDFLFSRAFQLMVRAGNLEVLKTLSQTSETISEGEVMQLQEINNLHLSKERYFSIIGAKTAALFKAACKVGSIIAGAPLPIQQALETYGYLLGLCFQIIDDILDYGSTQEETGKQTGGDFKEGKVTLPIIYAYSHSTTQEKKFWETAFSGKDSSALFHQAQAYLFKYNALNYAYEQAEKIATSAKQSLEIFEDSDLKKILLGLADFCLARKS